MLSKIFGNKKTHDTSMVSTRATLTITPVGPGLGGKQSQAVKIVHVGGHVERYYMATPASWIMQKHPSFVLARPEIFRRPWDSVVHPNDILIPGQKYYVVPRRTVQKLRRRVRKPGAMGPGFSLTGDKDSSLSSSFSGILIKPGIKVKARNRHVRFLGIDTSTADKRRDSESSISKSSVIKSKKKSANASNGKSANTEMHDKKRRARIDIAWEPALQSITE